MCDQVYNVKKVQVKVKHMTVTVGYRSYETRC